jgi:hypothetical protein
LRNRNGMLRALKRGGQNQDKLLRIAIKAPPPMAVWSVPSLIIMTAVMRKTHLCETYGGSQINPH